MLVDSKHVQIDMLYMGPGQGCRHVLRCDQLDFELTLDCDDELRSKQEAIAQLEDVAFQRFRSGKYQLYPTEHQTEAWKLVHLPDRELIESMYVENETLRDVVKRELIARGLFDSDIYRIGAYGSAEEQAIQLLIQKTEPSG